MKKQIIWISLTLVSVFLGAFGFEICTQETSPGALIVRLDFESYETVV